jgi:hypothetical protein
MERAVEVRARRTGMKEQRARGLERGGRTSERRERRGRLPAREIWRWPIVLALLTPFGLAAALLADGAGDIVGWAALLVPTAIGTRVLARAWRKEVSADRPPPSRTRGRR